MDELSEEDRNTVTRARKLQRFLSQPTHVAEKFTGIPGVYVPLKDTLEGFRAIVDGEADQYPEAAFYPSSLQSSNLHTIHSGNRHFA